MYPRHPCNFFVAVIILILAVTSTSAQSPKERTAAALRYGELPLAFELNMGQADPHIQFFSRGQGKTAYFTPRSMTLLLQSNPEGTAGDVLRFSVSEHGTAPRLAGEGRLPGKVNYLEAPRSGRPIVDVPLYSHLRYKGAYPGIDAVFYGNQKSLEYDFEVSPGADPSQIKLHVDGAQSLKLRPDGSLLIQGKYGSLHWNKPKAYQRYLDRGNVEIASSYVVRGNDISFRIAHYDRAALLVIDPQLVYSTYVGGNDFSSCCNFSNSIAVDQSGFAYITGTTVQLDHPVTPGAYDTEQKVGFTGSAIAQGFVTKLNQGGSALVYSTYLTGASYGSAIAVDDAGNAYVTGVAGDYTAGNVYTFRTTTGAYRRTLAGCCSNAFVLKLNATGTDAIYSTYIGNLQGGMVQGIALNTQVAGNSPQAYITGYVAGSPDFPTTTEAVQRTPQGNYDAFVTAVNGDGSGLVYSTYLGGSNNQARNVNLTGEDNGNAIAVRPNGNAVVTGFTRSDNFPVTNTSFGQIQTTGNSDIFVSELNATGSALVWSDLVGGPYDDFGEAIALDSVGNVYVGGDTWGGNFPTTNTALRKFSNDTKDGVVFALSPDGQSLRGSTFLGGLQLEHVAGLATDGLSVHVTGDTTSTDFPTTADAFQRTFPGGGARGAFYSVLNAQMSQLTYSTYLYSSGVFGPTGEIDTAGESVALDAQGSAYITGVASSGLPTTSAAYLRTTATPYNLPFVAKFGATAGSGDCSQGQVVVTTPANGFSGPSPVHFKAQASSGCRITAMHIYRDNALVFQTVSASIDTSLPIPVGAHFVVVQAFNSAGNVFKTPVNITVTSSGGGGSCSASAGTVRLCAPANGSTLPTPVTFSGAGALAGQTLLRLYVDNAPVFETTAASFESSIGLGSGGHYVVLVGYDNQGGARTASINFTSTGTGAIGCGTPSTNTTILICSPGQGETVHSPFQLTARARWDGNAITHMRVYSDNQPVYDQDTPPDGLISPTLSLGLGPHRIVSVAWNAQGASITSTALNINVN